ncbi:PREDICTED: uncharacterized protein LOC109239744 [Nicotiana attenuata]|uniref:uncharacterized protein LOC109239744 n=1 Tax=Nicotiana attenuata TaxID=49451 RepID=UPI00090493A0|nr:PREDICTED: uncharacterized protein LOC109239744 [Nicotiana attenuata]
MSQSHGSQSSSSGTPSISSLRLRDTSSDPPTPSTHSSDIHASDGDVDDDEELLPSSIYGWSLFQLDVNNAFLHGDLHEEAYMKLPQGSSGDIVILAVYVDDIILTGNNLVEISALKKFWIMRIEVSTSPDGVFLNQRKFVLDLLKEYNCLEVSSVVSPLDLNSKLKTDSGELFAHPERLPHMTAAFHMLRYLKGTIDVGLFYSNSPDCTLTVYSDSDWAACPDTPWKSKKQPVISLSSTEAEYRALSKVVAELTWLTRLLPDLSVSVSYPVSVFCDNQATIHITRNPVFHERTKHIEVGCHFVRKKLADGLI